MESVAGFSWNGWQLSSGISGRLRLEYAFKNFILKSKTVNRYKNRASRDLDDWMRVERNHSYPYVSDDQRDGDFKALVEAIDNEGSIVRLTGASGLGKSRLIVEAIGASFSIDEDCALIFDASGYENLVAESVRDAVDEDANGLFVVENCGVELHDKLVKEINKAECHLRIVTVGYSHEPVDDSIQIQLSTLSDEAIKTLLTPILVDLESSEVERVARFAQGYPLLATLIAEQYTKEGKLIGSITQGSVVRKLIQGDGGISHEEEGILSACSLFDVFGTEEGDAGKEAKFIAERVANSSLAIFSKVMNVFNRRQVIQRVGKYARLVPKPLALTLAGDWWANTSYDQQKQLIDTLPESLFRSFCIQASYLDSLPDVQRFSERLFSGPFGQAEVMLTERGSKLFRALVEVNPIATSKALYNVLNGMSNEELNDIRGDTRRNLVWGLEKLGFHANVFEESSWCMLLLASAENESWNNNATGLFAQFFRVNLSGTAAPPPIRFEVLRRAIEFDQPSVDMVVLDALGQAINTHSVSRSVGAEYQGTKATLEEWKPEYWQEVFDYWQEAFDLIIDMMGRGENQKERVLNLIGHSIRGFVGRGRIEMLDTAIRQIVEINGRYWPAALVSIKHTFSFDSAGLQESALEALNSWLDLLSSDNASLEEQLKIVVTAPPWEHRKNKDDQYVDLAAEKAKKLATKVASETELLYPHIDLLSQGSQGQAYAFGQQLALDLENLSDLLGITLEKLVNIEKTNLSFALGLYAGLWERSNDAWQQNIDFLLSDNRLSAFFPDFIRTGDIKKRHLDTLLELIHKDLVSARSANVLSYGSVTDGLEPEAITEFCLSLSKLGDEDAWVALDIIYMYCFGVKGRVGKIRNPLKNLITSPPLDKNQPDFVANMHNWQDLAKKLLEVRDEKLAIALAKQILNGTERGFDHSDLWNYIKPLLFELMRDYGDAIWPIFQKTIIDAGDEELYWLQQLLDRENSFSNQMPSVLSALPVSDVIKWCEDNPELGPRFTAACVNVFEKVDDQQIPSELFVALLVNFGGDEGVLDTLAGNIDTRGWSGSLVPYLEGDKAAISPLLEHSEASVRNWVKNHIKRIDQQIEFETERDEEEMMRVR